MLRALAVTLAVTLRKVQVCVIMKQISGQTVSGKPNRTDSTKVGYAYLSRFFLLGVHNVDHV